MRISFSPQFRDDGLTVSKAGDTLTVNRRVLDFSGIPDGATLPAVAVDSEFVVGQIERVSGDLHVTLILPVGPDAGEAARYPADIINPADGAIALPGQEG